MRGDEDPECDRRAREGFKGHAAIGNCTTAKEHDLHGMCP
jgi:hypothetical protein